MRDHAWDEDYGRRLDVLTKRYAQGRQPENRLVTSLLYCLPIGVLMWVGIIWAGKAAYAWWSVTR